MKFVFDNRFVRDLPQDPNSGRARREVLGALWSDIRPTPVIAPHLLAVSADMQQRLDLSDEAVRSRLFVDVFSGNALLPGMHPFAGNYGGHQFGSWAGQLGDGRAITLGEVVASDGVRWELQLKGAGETPYSRHADGRAVLRSSIREFLCSEAMYHLGIPTTRALCLIATGETVVRDMFYDGHPRAEPGAIVCRVAPGFLRFGHFELPSSRGEVALLRQLADFCIERDFPELAAESVDAPNRYARWFAEIAQRTAHLIAEWMRVGFVHGVMNTDNMSISGLTLDYGPYGWLSAYDPDFTPNTSDRAGRYRFGYQPRIALWNLQQLAAAISPLFADVAPLQAGLAAFARTYAANERRNAAGKLGLSESAEQAATVLLRSLYLWMQRAKVDMTLFFCRLAEQPAAAFGVADFADLTYEQAAFQGQTTALEDWLRAYREVSTNDDEEMRRARMRHANPRFILHNWISQQAIDAATNGNLAPLFDLMERLKTPYQSHPADAKYHRLSPAWATDADGVSRLSCSS